jgi:hypothetical protein
MHTHRFGVWPRIGSVCWFRFFINRRNLGFIYVNLRQNEETIRHLEFYLKYEPKAKDYNYIQELIKPLKVKEKEFGPSTL